MSNTQFTVALDLTQSGSGAWVIDSRGNYKRVKNLGWVLRNWKSITSFGWIYLEEYKRDGAGLFYARTRDGLLYITPYASFTVFVGFINRPIFAGLTVWIYDPELRQRASFKVGSSPALAEVDSRFPPDMLAGFPVRR